MRLLRLTPDLKKAGLARQCRRVIRYRRQQLRINATRLVQLAAGYECPPPDRYASRRRVGHRSVRDKTRRLPRFDSALRATVQATRVTQRDQDRWPKRCGSAVRPHPIALPPGKPDRDIAEGRWTGLTAAAPSHFAAGLSPLRVSRWQPETWPAALTFLAEAGSRCSSCLQRLIASSNEPAANRRSIRASRRCALRFGSKIGSACAVIGFAAFLLAYCFATCRHRRPISLSKPQNKPSQRQNTGTSTGDTDL